jgi:hypothetical protein
MNPASSWNKISGKSSKHMEWQVREEEGGGRRRMEEAKEKANEQHERESVTVSIMAAAIVVSIAELVIIVHTVMCNEGEDRRPRRRWPKGTRNFSNAPFIPTPDNTLVPLEYRWLNPGVCTKSSFPQSSVP